MRLTTYSLGVLALAWVGALVGCGKQDGDSSRFNDVLGGTVAGAPISRATPDLAILADQTAYKPAAVPGGGGAGETSGEGAAAAGGAADIEPIKAVAKSAIEAVFNLNIDGVFDAMVPEQIAAINGDTVRSEMQNAVNALQNFENEVADKSGQGTEKVAEQRTARAERRSAALLEEGSFDILSESAAALTIQPATLLKLMGTAEGLATPEGSEAASAAGVPDLEALAKMMPTVVINFTKAGDSWKIDLKKVISESEANDLASAFSDVTASVAKMSEALAGVQPTTPEDIGKALMPASMQLGMALAKIGMIMQAPGDSAPASAPAEEPKAEDKPAEGEGESAPAPVGTGRRGRSPRQP